MAPRQHITDWSKSLSELDTKAMLMQSSEQHNSAKVKVRNPAGVERSILSLSDQMPTHHINKRSHYVTFLQQNQSHRRHIWLYMTKTSQKVRVSYCWGGLQYIVNSHVIWSLRCYYWRKWCLCLCHALQSIHTSTIGDHWHSIPWVYSLNLDSLTKFRQRCML